MDVSRTILEADGPIVVEQSQTLDVTLAETARPIRAPDSRRRLVVLSSIMVYAEHRGGTLRLHFRGMHPERFTIVATGSARNRFTPIVLDPRTASWTFRIRTGQRRTLLIVKHSAATSIETVVAGLSDEARSQRELLREFLSEAEMPALLLPDQVLRKRQLLAFRGTTDVIETPPRAAAPQSVAPVLAAPHRAAPATPALELAQVGASMPPVVRLGKRVSVVVRLSRGRVHVDRGQAHDEHIIVVEPNVAVDVTLLRRNFALVGSRRSPESGHRKLRLPKLGAKDAEETFWLKPLAVGLGEVQVVVRQRAPQPLATLRLTSTILPSTAQVPASVEKNWTAPIPSSVSPFLAPKTLTVDENLEGTRSTLAFELVLPGVRERFGHVITDKPAILSAVFQGLEDAWKQHQVIENHIERSAAFQESLRLLGGRLAREALPDELLTWFRAHSDELDELTIITSGETDIPWELVHIWDDDAGTDPEGRGFLGRAGLVRWIYNTGHPEQLRIRPGSAYHLVPEYADPSLALRDAREETIALTRFGAKALDPSDGVTLSSLLHGGEVDLFHFAGHGLCDDSRDPPKREMLLAEYARPTDPPGPEPADRSKSSWSLDDLRQALPDEPPLVLDTPGPLVVLNACRIGQAPPTQRSEVGGFAESFLRAGAGAFVGCLWSVSDRPARAFVDEFYARLAAGSTMSRATIDARQAARRRGDLSWLAYVIYAHPDARLERRFPAIPHDPIPSSVTHERGTHMTTTASGARSVDLTRDELVAIHPYVIDVPDGKLSLGDSTLPTTIKDFRTTQADVDALFDTHLPEFLESQPGTQVPLVIYAHGGLVGKASGLGIAHKQVRWWLDNGAFPVHFVWETALLDSIWDAIRDRIPWGGRGLKDDLQDFAIEKAARALHARASWGAMKRTAELASGPGGGARYFARRLAEFVKANPGAISVHAVGHSAGSIFHSHLVPQLHSAGVPSIASLNLLAPAVRVDEFKARIMAPRTLARVDALTMFTMSEHFEKLDTCMGKYHKSLLYLIRAALEPDEDAEILGLQECVRRDSDVRALFGSPDSGAKGEVMWSKTVNGGPLSSSSSTSHGGFDDDSDTMDSLARRILGPAGLRLKRPFPRKARALEALELPTEPASDRQNGAEDLGERGRQPKKKALCIGIDAYPPGYALSGCVADAHLWADELGTIGFDVDVLLDAEATREEMVERIQNLVVSSRAGDVLVLQYSGHGTFVDDIDRDELEQDGEGNPLLDEAICPVDFADGNLLLDDDLGKMWDLLPDDVSLTIFFDSCHSGGSQRALLQSPLPPPGSTARLVNLDEDMLAAFIARRGVRSASGPAGPGDNERGVFFAACLPKQVAYESNGHGEFTRRAVPLLRDAVGSSSNRAFFNSVLTKFGDNPAQTPVLRPDYLASRALLGSAVASGTAEPATGQRPVEAAEEVLSSTLPTGAPTDRERAIATVLRGVADLIES